jgi:hypothetical protein
VHKFCAGHTFCFRSAMRYLCPETSLRDTSARALPGWFTSEQPAGPFWSTRGFFCDFRRLSFSGLRRVRSPNCPELRHADLTNESAMTSPIRFQVNSVRTLGTQSSKRELPVAVQPNLGSFGKIPPVEATQAAKPALASTRRDPGQNLDGLIRHTRPESPRERSAEDERTARASSAPTDVPFVALQRAIAASEKSAQPGAEFDVRPSEPPKSEAEVEELPEYEDPFLLVREHLKHQAEEGAAKQAKLEATVFTLSKEAPKPYGRAEPFESEDARSELTQVPNPFTQNRKARQASVAEAALRGAIAEGLAGSPARAPKKAVESLGASSAKVTQKLGAPEFREVPAASPKPAASEPLGARGPDTAVASRPWSTPTGDGAIRIPRGEPRAEIASSQYRAVEDNDYAKLLAVPGDGATGGRWSRIGATLPTFAFSVTS